MKTAIFAFVTFAILLIAVATAGFVQRNRLQDKIDTYERLLQRQHEECK